MAGAGVLFLADIFQRQRTQKTNNKLTMVALERRNFNKNGVIDTLSYSCATFSSGRGPRNKMKK